MENNETKDAIINRLKEEVLYLEGLLYFTGQEMERMDNLLIDLGVYTTQKTNKFNEPLCCVRKLRSCMHCLCDNCYGKHKLNSFPIRDTDWHGFKKQE